MQESFDWRGRHYTQNKLYYTSNCEQTTMQRDMRLKRCSHCARRRTTALDALKYDIGWLNDTGWFSPISYDVVRQLLHANCRAVRVPCGMRTPALNQYVQLQRHRTTSYDIGRCRTMSCAVWTPLQTLRWRTLRRNSQRCRKASTCGIAANRQVWSERRIITLFSLDDCRQIKQCISYTNDWCNDLMASRYQTFPETLV